MEEASGPLFEVWPDCWEAVQVFVDMCTQWRRAGMSGACCGLDYSALPTVLQMRQIPRKRWPEVFEDIRVLEDEMLEHWSKETS